MNKSTDELLEELKFRGTDIQEYINSNPDSMIEINLSSFWKNLVEKSGLANVDVINKSEISYVYFYDIVNGKKVPTSDKIVRIALAIKLTLDECQTALKYCGRAPLYPRIKRDSILIYAITHGLSVKQTNEKLIKENESELK